MMKDECGFICYGTSVQGCYEWRQLWSGEGGGGGGFGNGEFWVVVWKWL